MTIKHLILESPTGEFLLAEGQPKRFLKEVLRAGSYQHPITPWSKPLVVDEPYIDRLVEGTNKALQAGVDVWVPDGHSFKAEDNRGFVRRVEKRIVDGKPSVFAELDIDDDEILPKIGRTIRKVSAHLADYGDGRGNRFGDRIVHVALTPAPVATDQENFVALSLTPGTTERVEVKSAVLQSETTTMKFNEKWLKFLGLENAEPTLEQLEAALGKVEEKMLSLESREEPTVETMLSVDATQPFFVRAQKDRKRVNETLLSAAKKRGAINGEIEKLLEPLLAVEHGYSLSQDGKAVKVDVADAVEKLLELVPDNACVPVNRNLSAATPAPNKPSEEAVPFKDAEARQAEVNRMLKLGGLSK